MLALLPMLGWELVCPLIAMISIAVGCGPSLALMRQVRGLPVEARRQSHAVKDFYRDWRSVKELGRAWAVRVLLKLRLQRGVAAWGGRTFALAVFVALFAFVASGFGNVLAGPLLSLTKSTRLPVATILVVNDLVKFPGAALGSWLTRMVGPRRASFALLLSLCFSFALFAVARPMWSVPYVVTALIGFCSFFEAAWKVRLFALFMGLTRSESKATQYSVYMAATNFSKSWAAAGAALLATTDNVAAMYVVAVAAQLVILIPLRRLYEKRR
ncbi:hypothetical protein COV82_02095 [Candidatus Peregrinibacteria bacterium CG11_big_fil_rev_8_21_14_0_20_46_8]|nr:MAG: hypothetical protein COV82_02095 [Candidatus Peregrinibacteria bacterium CG11_big_fil_rev_8_21_14_0_20_46_8]